MFNLAGLIFVDETAAAERPLPARRAPAHKAIGIREAIEARGATLRYLPQYSPDLNPHQDAVQQAERRNEQGRGIGTFACTLTLREACNYFRHVGYE
jgi:transposase